MALAANSRTAINAAIRRATFAAHRDMQRLDEQGLRDLARVYRDAAADIAARIREHAGPDGNLALEELRSALAQVEARLQALSRARNAVIDTGLTTAAQLGVRPFEALLEPQAGLRVADEAVRFVRAFVAEDGLQLSDRIWRMDRGARDAVVNAIERSVIEGHGAAQAAREFLSSGRPVPIDVQQKIGAAGAARISRETTTQLLTGAGNALDNATRLFRTEINRAHGEAYMASGEGHPDFAGWQYLLSPAHPEPDICDLLSSQNLHGLGAGVYPDRASTPWPAHPNTLSFVVIKFRDEVTTADREGKETPIEALRRLTPEQQIGVLGKAKKALFDQGKISRGMIRTPLRSVRARIGVPVRPDLRPTPPTPPARPRRPETLDEMIQAGRQRTDAILTAVALGDGMLEARFTRQLLTELRAERPTARPARIGSRGRGATLVREASMMFPDDWTRVADRLGTIEARYRDARAFYRHNLDGTATLAVRDINSAVHEFTHRLQHALRALDDYFQDLHNRRTTGAALQRLSALTGNRAYRSDEVAREDRYIDPYQGRVYRSGAYLGKHGALEVMTMAFETVLAGRGDALRQMLSRDREMVDLVVGTLFNYVP